jgi:hypothetical protein
LTRIQQARQRILDAQPELQPVLEKAELNSGSRTASRVVEEFRHIERGLEKLQTLGVMVKDLDTGLVDFLSLRDGREVLLCWRLGEKKVSYWHELHTGFAGRQPL